MQTEYERITTASSVHVERSQEDMPRKERIIAQLRALLGILLHSEPTDIVGQSSFLELGADSLVLLDAVKQIEQTFGIKLPIRQLFSELSTLDALATYLDEVLPVDTYSTDVLPAADVLPNHGPKNHNATSHAENIFDASEHRKMLSEQRRSLSIPNAIDVEHIFARQLEILHQQLAILQNYAASAAHTDRVGPSPVSKNAKTILASDGPDSDVQTDITPSRAQTPYVSYQPIRPKGTEALNTLQQHHLDNLRARLTRRTQMSRDYAQRYRPMLADNRASAGFRFSIKEMLYPIVAKKSQGAYFWDLDGNRYLDITMGFGVNLFGHNAPFIQDALTQQLETGIQLGPQSDLAGEVAMLIHELTGMERVTFCNSGTEAVMTAVRLARTATGKNKIVLFSGSYHGTFDGILARAQPQSEHGALPLAPGVPEKMIDDVLVLPYGNEHALDIIQSHAHELAAVLVEPVQSRHPDIQPREFLQQLRVLTQNTGVALIFDETITGFRIHLGGAQAWFGVQADLATYGKIIGGGMPIGIVAGKAHYLDGIDGGMWHYGDLSYPQAETTFFAGTFCKHPLAMSGAHAVLSYLKSQGQALQERLNAKTAHLVTMLNAFFQDEQVPIVCIHFGSLFRFSFTQNMDLFFYHLLEKGIYIWEGRNCFLSTAHTDEDIAQLIQAVKETIWALRDGDFLPKPPSGGTSTRSSEDDTSIVQDESGENSFVATFPPEVHAQREQDASSKVVKHSFPLTAAQQHFWAASQVDARGGFNSYIETAVLQLDGEFSLPAMQNAFRIIVSRHEALRTVISAQGDLQYVLPEVPVDVSYQNLSSVSADVKPQLVSHWLEEQQYQGLDLTHGPLVSLSILNLENQRHLLLFAAHHIIADGWSITLVLQEIAQVYTAQVQRRPYQLDTPLQFREYVYWQEQQKRQGMQIADERFWTAQLAEPFPSLALPLDHPRAPYKTFAGASIHLGLDIDLQRALRQLASRQGCTLYMVLLATYLLWLHHVSGQNDVVVGVPTAGRIGPGSETLVGNAMNLFPLRSTLVGSPTFLEYLHTVKLHLLELYEHQDYPLSTLQKKLDPQGQLYTLYTTFNLDPTITFDDLGDLTVTTVAAPVHYVKFDICVFVTTSTNEINVDVHYNSDIFKAENMQAQAHSLHALLESICVHPDLSVWRQSRLTSVFPLSFAQQRLWFLDQLEPGSIANNTTSAVYLRGKLHLGYLQRSLDEIISRHESLRTVFQSLDNKPVQSVVKAANELLLLIDLRSLLPINRELQLRLLMQQDALSPFNLTHSTLFRVTLFHLIENEHVLLLTAHHIAFDGWSLDIFSRELSELYDAFSVGKLLPLTPLPLQYADFVYRQRSLWQGGVWDQHVNYWIKQLQGATPLDLPTDRPRTEPPNTLGAFASFDLSVQLSENLSTLCHQQDVTLFMTLLATFQVLLYRYTGRADLIVGTEVANRTQGETEGIIGRFANLLALRTDLSGHPTFREVLHIVRRVVRDAYAHQDLPFEKLVELLRLEQFVHQNPLIRILFVLQDSPASSLTFHDVEVSPLYSDINTTQFDLAIFLREGAQGLSGKVNYRNSLFDRSTIVRLIKHFDTLLYSVVAQPDCLVDSLEMYSETERKEHTNDKTVSYEAHRRKLKTAKRNVVDFEHPPQM